MEKNLTISVSCPDWLSARRPMPAQKAYSPFDVERTRKAIEYIHRHFSETFSPDMLAEEVNMDVKKLQFVMQVLTGCTVHFYQLGIRIAHAKSALADFCKPIKCIARENGFHSATHFNREFKKRERVTPGKYRFRLMVAEHDPAKPLHLN